MFGLVKKSKLKLTKRQYGTNHLEIHVEIDGETVKEGIISFDDAFPEKYYELLRLKLEVQSLRSSSKTTEQSSIWHVLGCMPTTDRTIVERSFKKMAMVYHPDHGGSSAAFVTLQKAKEKALAKCK